MPEKQSRSIVKAASWRAVATTTTMVLVFLFTGELVLSMGVGLLEVISKMILYYGHERAWNKINWGKSL